MFQAPSKPKKDRSSITHFIIQVLIILCFISPVSAYEILAGSANLGELITNLINNVGEAVDQEISNKEGFKSNFTDWYEAASNNLEDILESMGLVIKDYAENEGEFDQQHVELTEDFSQVVDQLNDVLSQYPEFEEVRQIIEPHIYEFEDVFRSRFPTLGPIHAHGNPLGNLFVYYQEVERTNPLDMGSFFRIEFLEPSSRLKDLNETILEQTTEGIKTEKIIFQRIDKYQNGILIFHKLVINDEVIELVKTLEDFSVLHGLPSKMRIDGVNENVILLTEEYLNLINFHLLKAFEEEGLEIPSDHPQLVVPTGYTPDIFVQNFTDILLALEQDFT